MSSSDTLTLLKGVVDVQVGQVITVDVSESRLGLVSLLFHLARTHEALWY
jgi:hypothetical protein